MKAIVLGLAIVLASATAASAIDCAKAKTDLDKAICASPELKAADDAMGKAYAAAAKAVGAKMAKVLKADQADWNGQRMDWCTPNDGNATTPEALASCLLGNTELRRKFLAGEPLEGPGAEGEKVVPQVITGLDQMFNRYVLFADPQSAGAKIFNKALAIELRDIRMATEKDKMSDSFELTLMYLSPTLLSARIDVDQEEGFAHPMVSTHAINLDMTTGRPLTMDLMLDQEALAAIQKQCADEMAGEHVPEDVIHPDFLPDTIANLDSWTFGATSATIRYIVYGMTNPATCTVGYDQLRPLIKAGFPLPQ